MHHFAKDFYDDDKFIPLEKIIKKHWIKIIKTKLQLDIENKIQYKKNLEKQILELDLLITSSKNKKEKLENDLKKI